MWEAAVSRCAICVRFSLQALATAPASAAASFSLQAAGQLSAHFDIAFDWPSSHRTARLSQTDRTLAIDLERILVESARFRRRNSIDATATLDAVRQPIDQFP
jgi:hypothetical protein